MRLAGLEAALHRRGDSFTIAEPDAASLADGDVLIVASRSQLLPFTSQAVAAIAGFVERGGGLLLMANHRGMIAPQQQLATALALPFAFEDRTIENFPEVRMESHAVSWGVAAVRLRNSSALRHAREAQPIAQFSAAPGLLFAVGCSSGAGRVVATGDSGFIASRDDAGLDLWSSADNARFLTNALDWLRG